MRFNIQLTKTSNRRYLPVDYQYSLSAWVYKVIAGADAAFSEFLHTQGYATGNKQFKLFCYSPLNLGKPKLWKEKGLFEVFGDPMSLKVSFQLAEAAEKFIIGLFNHQRLYLGDRFNGLDLSVAQVERLPDATIAETMKYRAVSPVVISVKNSESLYAQYLSPGDDGYAGLLKKNLLHKYNAVPGNDEIAGLDFFDFKVLSVPRSKLVTIKPHTDSQSKVRGYIYDFSLTCPVALHQLIQSAGLGEKNATGFGWCEVLQQQQQQTRQVSKTRQV